MILLMWSAGGGAAVADDAVIELQYMNAVYFTWLFGSGSYGLPEGSHDAAQDRTAVNFAVEAMGRAGGLASVFSGHAPFVPSGARPAPGTGPVPVIQGVAEVVVREPFAEQPPRAEADAAGAETAGSILPNGLLHQFAVVPGRNSIAVRGTPKAIDEFREIVGLLDTPVKRVHLSISLHEVGAAELQAKVPDVAEAPGGDDPPIRFALPDTDVLTDPGDLGRVLARVECTVPNGSSATVSLAQIIPVSIGGTITYDADGNRVGDYAVAVLAGICMEIQVGFGRDGHTALALRCLLVEAEGQTDVIMPADIEVSDLAQMMVGLHHSESLVMSGPSTVERWNEICGEHHTGESRIEEDLRAVIVITPTVIMPDEGAAQ